MQKIHIINNIYHSALITILLALLCFSCSERPLPSPELPQTQILSLRKRWVVVSHSYLPLYESGDVKSDVVWVARRGDVFEVLDQSLKTEFLYTKEEYWYLLRHELVEGWAFGADLHSFFTQAEAQNAAYRLESGEGF